MRHIGATIGCGRNRPGVKHWQCDNCWLHPAGPAGRKEIAMADHRSIRAREPLSDTITGSDDIDYMSGSMGPDSLDGRGGDDFLSGLSGDDTLIGGEGDDTVDGSDGDDVLTGG